MNLMLGDLSFFLVKMKWKNEQHNARRLDRMNIKTCLHIFGFDF